ncbi:MAG: cytochrome c [Chloroflexi bacterium]|nr:cytochrome c [Chloroflexota bacterium]
MPRTLPLFFLIPALLLAACSSGASEDIPPTFTPDQARGQQVFAINCASCHATQPDMLIVGPSLAGIARVAAERAPGEDAQTYLVSSILDPDAFIVPGFNDLMPKTFGKTLSGEDLDALIEYLFTLE